MLRDSFGRAVTDLRISVTDWCNFRCRYCMPPEGLPWLERSSLLTFEEIARVTRVFVGLGIDSIKIAGGEPLARRDAPSLVGMLRQIDDGVDISMTTNGYLLAEHARPLKDAGLDRVTVSCDSLIAHRFAQMTLRDAFDRVMEGLWAAVAAGLAPIKVNTVVIARENDDEVVAFAKFARATGFTVRFVEYMPLDAQREWSAERVVPAGAVLERINRRYPLVRLANGHDADTSFGFADGAPGQIGIIPSVTEPFCASCNRIRITPDGQLRACLFALEETDLRNVLRSSSSDQELEVAIRGCVARKWAGHRIGKPDFERPARSMSQIGG